MAINMDDLKPILTTLVDGREDAADILEQVTAIDVAEDDTKIASTIASAVADATKAINKEWNDRFVKQFMNPVEVEVETHEDEDDDYEETELSFEDFH